MTQLKRHKGTPNFSKVPPISTEQPFFSAEVVLSTTLQFLGKKTPQNTFFTEQLPVADFKLKIKYAEGNLNTGFKQTKNQTRQIDFGNRYLFKMQNLKHAI